jgi:hypothetical protein
MLLLRLMQTIDTKAFGDTAELSKYRWLNK